MTPVRILVADDHEVVRRGVRALLEVQRDWHVCGEAGTGREAVALALALQPDVIVIDIAMPELNGLEATRQIRQHLPARILVLTVHESDQVVAEVIHAGAHGYVLKDEAGHTLVEAIRALLAQREFFTDRVRAAAARRKLPHGTPLPGHAPAHLTGREREILQLLAEGRSSKEIGARLGISVRTAETHRARIMTKLGSHSVAELVRYAIRNRIIDP